LPNLYLLGYPEDALQISGENVNIGLFADRKAAFNMLSEEGQAS
jgi:hypothetical protein